MSLSHNYGRCQHLDFSKQSYWTNDNMAADTDEDAALLRRCTKEFTDFFVNNLGEGWKSIEVEIPEGLKLPLPGWTTGIVSNQKFNIVGPCTLYGFTYGDNCNFCFYFTANSMSNLCGTTGGHTNFQGLCLSCYDTVHQIPINVNNNGTADASELNSSSTNSHVGTLKAIRILYLSPTSFILGGTINLNAIQYTDGTNYGNVIVSIGESQETGDDDLFLIQTFSWGSAIWYNLSTNEYYQNHLSPEVSFPRAISSNNYQSLVPFILEGLRKYTFNNLYTGAFAKTNGDTPFKLGTLVFNSLGFNPSNGQPCSFLFDITKYDKLKRSHGGIIPVGDIEAKDVKYNNIKSGMKAINVQSAIDELKEYIDENTINYSLDDTGEGITIQGGYMGD